MADMFLDAPAPFCSHGESECLFLECSRRSLHTTLALRPYSLPSMSLETLLISQYTRFKTKRSQHLFKSCAAPFKTILIKKRVKHFIFVNGKKSHLTRMTKLTIFLVTGIIKCWKFRSAKVTKTVK